MNIIPPHSYRDEGSCSNLEKFQMGGGKKLNSIIAAVARCPTPKNSIFIILHISIIKTDGTIVCQQKKDRVAIADGGMC